MLLIMITRMKIRHTALLEVPLPRWDLPLGLPASGWLETAHTTVVGHWSTAFGFLQGLIVLLNTLWPRPTSRSIINIKKELETGQLSLRSSWNLLLSYNFIQQLWNKYVHYFHSKQCLYNQQRGMQWSVPSEAGWSIMFLFWRTSSKGRWKLRHWWDLNF